MSDTVRQLSMGAAFTLKFDTPILEKLATIGKFDGKNPSLTVGTVGDRLLMHVPAGKEGEQQQQSAGNEIKSLNIGKTVTALSSGALKKGHSDYIIIGTQTSLSAYDVDRNSDAFFRDVEGVTSLVVAPIDGETPLAVVGSGSSVMGYDVDGKDQYWTVTSDSVSSLGFLPWGNGFPNALLVGTEDYEIRIYDNARAVGKIVESDKATQLVATGAPGRFIYSLGNGTVGVYQHEQRQWKFKSKHKVTSVSFCDVNFDGVPEVIVGWDNGKFEVRADGAVGKEVIYKETLSSPVSAVLHADYRRDGRDLPIVCTYDGSVSGFVAMEQTATEEVEAHSQRVLEKQMDTKQQLLNELSALETQLDMQRKGEVDASLPTASTAVTSMLRPNRGSGCVEIVLTATEGAVIRSAVITGPGLFGSSESSFFYAEEEASEMVIPIRPEKDVESQVQVTVLVGTPMAEVFQVHDLGFTLPKFAMYLPVSDFGGKPEPAGSVTAHIQDATGRITEWLTKTFSGYLKPDHVRAPNVEGRYISLRDETPITITATPANSGEFVVRCDSMEIAGEMLQSMGHFMGITELPSIANFQQEFAAIEEILYTVDVLNSVRMKLTAEMADSTQLVKALVIKAEDARILCDMPLMKKMYANLYDVNRELIGEYLKRSNNHQELLSILKKLHAVIEKSSNLRIGKAKAQVVADCRAAIKSQNKKTIINIIRNGTA